MTVMEAIPVLQVAIQRFRKSPSHLTAIHADLVQVCMCVCVCMCICMYVLIYVSMPLIILCFALFMHLEGGILEIVPGMFLALALADFSHSSRIP